MVVKDHAGQPQGCGPQWVELEAMASPVVVELPCPREGPWRHERGSPRLEWISMVLLLLRLPWLALPQLAPSKMVPL